METETVKTVKHTPLPWHQSHSENEDGMYTTKIYNHVGVIATMHWLPIKLDENTTGTTREPNAEFIVRACNSHYELLKCLAMIDECLSDGIPVEKNDPIHKKIKDLLTK